MKTARELANEISRTCVERIRGQYSFNIKTCSDAIESRDSEHADFAAEACKVVADEWKAIHDKAVAEHAAALAKLQERCRVLEEHLENLALCGFEDFGGSYVNLQVNKDDILAARAALEGR